MPIRSSHFPSNAPRTIARTTAAFLTAALITACATDQPAPTGLNASLDESRGVPFTEGLASPAWQLTARNLVSAANQAAVQATQSWVSPSTWRCSGPRLRSATQASMLRTPPATALVPGDVSGWKPIAVQSRAHPSWR